MGKGMIEMRHDQYVLDASKRKSFTCHGNRHPRSFHQLVLIFRRHPTQHIALFIHTYQDTPQTDSTSHAQHSTADHRLLRNQPVLNTLQASEGAILGVQSNARNPPSRQCLSKTIYTKKVRQQKCKAHWKRCRGVWKNGETARDAFRRGAMSLTVYWTV
jgi:hypothetical protein